MQQKQLKEKSTFVQNLFHSCHRNTDPKKVLEPSCFLKCPAQHEKQHNIRSSTTVLLGRAAGGHWGWRRCNYYYETGGRGAPKYCRGRSRETYSQKMHKITTEKNYISHFTLLTCNIPIVGLSFPCSLYRDKHSQCRFLATLYKVERGKGWKKNRSTNFSKIILLDLW